MKKQVFLGMVTIALVGIGAGAVLTGALFNSQQNTGSNKLSVGTLDLQLGENSSSPFVIENIGSLALIKGEKTWEVKNSGTLPGRLLLSVKNLNNKSSGCINEPKKLADPKCGETGHEGNLGKAVKATISIDGVDVVTGQTMANADQDKFVQLWDSLPQVILEPGQKKMIGFRLNADEADYGNEIQGDSLQFDIEFNLVQQPATI
ncbi:MAG: hypothetical protein WCL07_01325 [bacterium]